MVIVSRRTVLKSLDFVFGSWTFRQVNFTIKRSNWDGTGNEDMDGDEEKIDDEVCSSGARRKRSFGALVLAPVTNSFASLRVLVILIHGTPRSRLFRRSLLTNCAMSCMQRMALPVYEG